MASCVIQDNRGNSGWACSVADLEPFISHHLGSHCAEFSIGCKFCEGKAFCFILFFDSFCEFHHCLRKREHGILEFKEGATGLSKERRGESERMRGKEGMEGEQESRKEEKEKINGRENER